MKKVVFLDTPAQLPDKDTLHLWVNLIPDPENNLSEEEKKRCSHYRFEKDGLAFAAGRSLLRRHLSDYLDSNFQLKTGTYGKPYIENSPLHFNLSHSEPWLALAYGLTPVGIDIETIRPLDDIDMVISDCFSPQEQAYVNCGPMANKTDRFWHIWCRKEACLKALGCGLGLSFDCLAEAMEEWTYLPFLKVWVRSYFHPEYTLAIAYG